MNTIITGASGSGGGSTPGSPSRVSAGIPRAPLRSAPRPPSPSPADPADTNTLNMLGSNPLNSADATLDDSPTGGAGFLMGSLAMTAKGIQGLSTAAPGFVPPEILMWLDNAMQQLPQLLQQQSSPLRPQQQAGPQGALPGMPPAGPPRAPMGALTGGMDSMGGGQM